MIDISYHGQFLFFLISSKHTSYKHQYLILIIILKTQEHKICKAITLQLLNTRSFQSTHMHSDTKSLSMFPIPVNTPSLWTKNKQKKTKNKIKIKNQFLNFLNTCPLHIKREAPHKKRKERKRKEKNWIFYFTFWIPTQLFPIVIFSFTPFFHHNIIICHHMVLKYTIYN